MRKMLAITTAVIGLSVLGAQAPAAADARSHGCKVVSVTKPHLEFRTVDGVLEYRSTIKTTSKCRGRLVTTTQITDWHPFPTFG